MVNVNLNKELWNKFIIQSRLKGVSGSYRITQLIIQELKKEDDSNERNKYDKAQAKPSDRKAAGSAAD